MSLVISGTLIPSKDLMDKQQLRQVIHSFLGELSALAASTEVSQLPDREFVDELREAREYLQDRELTLEQVLIAAIGICDQFVNAMEDSLVDATLAFERDQGAVEGAAGQ